jgi:hypothetical protein
MALEDASSPNFNLIVLMQEIQLVLFRDRLCDLSKALEDGLHGVLADFFH